MTFFFLFSSPSTNLFLVSVLSVIMIETLSECPLVLPVYSYLRESYLKIFGSSGVGITWALFPSGPHFMVNQHRYFTRDPQLSASWLGVSSNGVTSAFPLLALHDSKVQTSLLSSVAQNNNNVLFLTIIWAGCVYVSFCWFCIYVCKIA